MDNSFEDFGQNKENLVIRLWQFKDARRKLKGKTGIDYALTLWPVLQLIYAVA